MARRRKQQYRSPADELELRRREITFRQKVGEHHPVLEAEAAGRRIGRTEDARLQWFLNFAQMNLDQLGAGDLHNLRWEIWALSPLPPGFDDFPDDSEIRSIHSTIRRALDTAEDSPQTFPICVHYYFPFDPDRGKARTHAKGFVDQVCKRFFDLLVSSGDLLGKCARNDCRRWFVGRPNKKYCSTRCLNLEMTHRFRRGKEQQ